MLAGWPSSIASKSMSPPFAAAECEESKMGAAVPHADRAPLPESGVGHVALASGVVLREALKHVPQLLRPLKA